MDDKYSYPGTDVLINNFNVKDPKKLILLEAAYTGLRLAELQLRSVKGNFDLLHLQKIHKYIFQDIYPFAGEIRDVNISKGFPFAQAKFIHSASEEVFNRLKEDHFLKGLTKEHFSYKAACYMTDINVLHPFREGNGRSNREFIRCLAGNAGYQLQWSKVSPRELLNASIKATTNERDLINLIKDCITNDVPSIKLSRKFSPNVNRRDNYLER